MMKKISILFFAVFLTVLASCQKEGSAEIECFFTEQSIPYTGGSVSVFISSNAPWTASWTDTEEISVDPSSGRGDAVVTIMAKPNSDGRTRSARVTFLAEKSEDDQRSVNFVVSRDAKPFLSCDEKTRSIPAAGGAVYFCINSNYPWKVTGAAVNGEDWDWTGLINPQGCDRNLVDVRVDVPQNAESSAKVYTITFALADFPDNTIILTVNQEGA